MVNCCCGDLTNSICDKAGCFIYMLTVNKCYVNKHLIWYINIILRCAIAIWILHGKTFFTQQTKRLNVWCLSNILLIDWLMIGTSQLARVGKGSQLSYRLVAHWLTGHWVEEWQELTPIYGITERTFF